MTDFNQDDRTTPPVASPQTVEPPQNHSRRKQLSSDELIALFLAFTGIGSILFWSLSQKTSSINLSALTSGDPAFSNGTAVSPVATPSSDGVPFTGVPQPSRAAISLPPVAAQNQTTSSKFLGPATSQPISGESESAKGTGATNAAGIAGVAGAIATSQTPTSAPIEPVNSANPAKGTVDAPVKAKAFSDIPSDFWAKDAIVALANRGVITGFSDGTFKPSQPINRAEFAGIVQKAFDQQNAKPVMKFTDIKDGFWAMSAIDKATQMGFMTGYPGGVFKPEQAIPRLEMMSAIATGMNLKPQGDPTQALSRYSDAKDLPKWAVPNVSRAIESGIMIPNSTVLEPNKTATRADAAMFIYQALIKDGKVKP